jgi:predicted 3-demethylubiquinone-9 3-methyltransferase (glyoxalase superfamily)
MQKIIPHLWFDTEAKEATEFYVSVFKELGEGFGESKIQNISKIENTPSGDCDTVSFMIAGLDMMAISAGPYFKINPSISMFVSFDTEEQIKAVHDKLIKGGEAMMEYNEYPWAKKYAWIKDKYGLTWQLTLPLEGMGGQAAQRVTPLLMYTQDMAGKAKEAVEFYTSVFPNSKVEVLVPYEKGEGDVEGNIKHGRFQLHGQNFMAMESAGPHEFKFNEGVSLLVNCDSQEEIDEYWEKLSADPESEQCGWLKDKYGVSWQINSSEMNEMMKSSDQEAVNRVTQAFLKMKKFDLETLRKAFEGK